MKKIMMLLLVITSTMYADNLKSDAAYSKTLIGKWQQSLKQGTANIDGIMIYKKDGILDSTATITVGERKIVMSISGTWEVKDGELISTVKSKSANCPIPIGFVSKDKIMKLTDSTFTYKTKEGKTESQSKVK